MLLLHAPPHPQPAARSVLVPTAQQTYYERAGALHVHTTYSDGRGSFEEVARTAERCGLDFLITADHGTLAPLREGKEGYYGDCLALAGVEISCDEGYVLGFDLPAEFDPARGEAARVLAAIQAAGGFGFLSLVCDPCFAWRHLPTNGFTGIEIVNMGTMGMRRINPPNLLRALIRYRLGGTRHAFALLARRPTPELRAWDRLTQERRVVGIGSTDAHARLKVFKGHIPYPSYEDSFSLMRTHVLCLEEATGDARRDAAQIYEALAAGRCFASFHVHGEARGFRFFASTKHGEATLGEEVPWEEGLTLHAHANGQEAVFRLIGDGAPLATFRGRFLEYPVTRPGVYRVEVYRWGQQAGPFCLCLRPWILSNPIYVRPAGATVPTPPHEAHVLQTVP